MSKCRICGDTLSPEGICPSTGNLEKPLPGSFTPNMIEKLPVPVVGARIEFDKMLEKINEIIDRVNNEQT